MHRGDGGLQLVGAGPCPAQGALEHARPLGDAVAVPAPPILLVEPDRGAGVVGAGRPPGIGEEQQGQEPERLGVVGHRARPAVGRGAAPRRTGRLGRGRRPRWRCGPRRRSGRRRAARRPAGRAADRRAGRGRGCRRPRSCAWPVRGAGTSRPRSSGTPAPARARSSPPSDAQRQREPRLHARAGWQHVNIRRSRSSVTALASWPRSSSAFSAAASAERCRRSRCSSACWWAAAGLLAPEPVDGAAAGGGGEPHARPPRNTGARPLGGRGHEGVLHRILGEGEVAADLAGERGQHRRPLVAVGTVQLGGDLGGPAAFSPARRRTAAGPRPSRTAALGNRAARAVAASRSGRSTM